MIIGSSFIWLHLPKTGGTSTARLFRDLSFNDICVDSDESDAKHDSLSMRITQTELDMRDKKVFITLRRLVAWLISDWHHKTMTMGLELPFEPVRSGLFYSLRLGGTWVAADYWLHYFSIGSCDAVIRLEYIEDDANQIVHPLLPEGSPRLIFPHQNTKNYSRHLGYFFNSKDIGRIYENNPLWREWEHKSYGNEIELTLAEKIYRLKRFV